MGLDVAAKRNPKTTEQVIEHFRTCVIKQEESFRESQTQDSKQTSGEASAEWSSFADKDQVRIDLREAGQTEDAAPNSARSLQSETEVPSGGPDGQARYTAEWSRNLLHGSSECWSFPEILSREMTDGFKDDGCSD